MKIEWLNDEMTRVRITKGWFRKRVAIARRLSSDEWHRQQGYNWWRFELSGRGCNCGSAIERARDIELYRRAFVEDWQPVEPLPKARLLRGDS